MVNTLGSSGLCESLQQMIKHEGSLGISELGVGMRNEGGLMWIKTLNLDSNSLQLSQKSWADLTVLLSS